MTDARQSIMSGGCQCGAVRYRIYAMPTGPSICHCRMCQKAFGAPFAPLASVKVGDIEWTRGAPRIFDSSGEVERGFCANCGTPLTYAYRGRGVVDIALASLDDPSLVAPAEQIWTSARIPWAARLHALPGREADEAGYDEIVEKIAASNHQHPDRDTPNEGADAWVPRASREWTDP